MSCSGLYFNKGRDHVPLGFPPTVISILISVYTCSHSSLLLVKFMTFILIWHYNSLYFGQVSNVCKIIVIEMIKKRIYPQKYKNNNRDMHEIIFFIFMLITKYTIMATGHNWAALWILTNMFTLSQNVKGTCHLRKSWRPCCAVNQCSWECRPIHLRNSAIAEALILGHRNP